MQPTDPTEVGALVENESLEVLIEKGRKVVRDVSAKGDRAWRMCVPVHRDDADEVLTRALDRLSTLAAENERLTKQNKTQAQMIAELVEVIGVETGWSWADLEDARAKARRSLRDRAALNPSEDR